MRRSFFLGLSAALLIATGAALASDPIVSDQPELPKISSLFGAPPEEARNPLRGVELGSVVDLTMRGSQGASIGTVEDILLDSAGEPHALLVHEGGFLGFGGRIVQIDVKDINFLLEYTGREITLDALTAQDVAALPAYQPGSEAVRSFRGSHEG